MSYCKYQRCVEMKVLDNSFSRIVHISGEILKFTLCTDIYSTVNKNVVFFFNFLLEKKKSPTCRRNMVRGVSNLFSYRFLGFN